VLVAINGLANYDDFQVMPLGNYDAILGIPWLTEINPEIDWRERTMTITREGQRVTMSLRDGLRTTRKPRD
jgi:hypothetical protein